MSIRTRFGRVVILVEDYDQAFEFYEKNNSHFYCADLYGNQLVLVELPGTTFKELRLLIQEQY